MLKNNKGWFKKGQPSAFKDRKHTKKAKLKNKLAHLGKSRPGNPENWKHKGNFKRFGLKNIGLHRSPKTEFKKGKKSPKFEKFRLFALRKAIKGKLRFDLRDKKLSDETKKKISEALKGEKNYRWIKNRKNLLEGKRIRRLTEYTQWRLKILERDDYRCMDCGQRGGQLEIDHILSFTKYPRLRFDINNGQTLCRSCHKAKTKLERTKICLS